MFGKKKKKALTKQERRIASSVNTKPKKPFKQNKVNRTNYPKEPLQGFYVDKTTKYSNDTKQHISWQLNADDKTWTRIGPLTHKKRKVIDILIYETILIY